MKDGIGHEWEGHRWEGGSLDEKSPSQQSEEQSPDLTVSQSPQVRRSPCLETTTRTRGITGETSLLRKALLHAILRSLADLNRGSC